MSRRRQCWSDSAAPCDQSIYANTGPHSFSDSEHCHARARSLHNLNCLPQDTFDARGRKHASSSSSGILISIAQLPQYPLLPCQSPQSRSPTPPGLPSFSTGEAERLRLMPLTHFERFTRFLQLRLARRDEAGENLPPQRSSQVESRDNMRLNDEPTEILRRLLGTSMPVSMPAQPVQPRRAGLPRGVIRSAYPGPLAQADDKTHVRGRFGARASGHGVGQRNLNHHPLARLTNSSEVAAAIRDIDKACGEQDNHDGAGSASYQEIHLRRGSENALSRAASTTAMAIAESLTAIQAIEREQTALRALRVSRRENARLKVALKNIRASSSLAPAQSQCRISSDVSDYYAAQTVPEEHGVGADHTARVIVGTAPLRGDSEQTMEENGATPIADDQPTRTQPMLYSSYSSYSYTPSGSDIAPLHQSRQTRRALPTMESMIEHQVQEMNRHATDDALQRCQDEKTKCEHC